MTRSTALVGGRAFCLATTLLGLYRTHARRPPPCGAEHVGVPEHWLEHGLSLAGMGSA